MEKDLTNKPKILREYLIPADGYLSIGLPTRWLSDRDKKRCRKVQVIQDGNDIIIRKKAVA